MEAQTAIPFLRTRLSLQMFLQFAIWGAWIPVFGNHLGGLNIPGEKIGYAYLTGPLALMLSPLLAGQIADRWFAVQKYLGYSYLACGGLLIWLANSAEYNQIWWISFAVMLFFGPTLGLSNALCFYHLQDARKDFPIVRLFGTLGWIAACWLLTLWMYLTQRPIGDSLYLAALFSILNGLYSFTLPHMPPQKSAKEAFALGKVLRMLKDPSFAVFTFLAFLLLVFGTFYYNFSGLYFEKGVGVKSVDVPLVTSAGQALECVTMFLLPWALRTLGTKKTMAIGIAMWAARFGLFTLCQPKELMVGAQALHGFSFAFGVAAAMIYVEKISDADVRGSVQSFLAWATYGLGMFVGSILSGYLAGRFTDSETGKLDYHALWTVPALGCAGILVLFLLFFRARDTQTDAAPPAGAA